MVDQVHTMLAETISEAMTIHGVTIQDMAKATGMTYETIRGIIRGKRRPSTKLLKEICEILEMDYAETAKFAAADHLERKFGDIDALFGDKPKDLRVFERYWEKLDERQKDDLTEMARRWSISNRETAKNS